MRRLTGPLLILLFGVAALAYGQAPPIEMENEPESNTPVGDSDVLGDEDFGVGEFDEDNPTVVISDGTRIDVKDFSIKPPAGWEVYRNRSKLSLMLQIPFQEDMPYQRTIQVAARKGEMFIDETTAKEFEEELVKQFTKYDAAIQNYRVRNYRVIEMTDGRPALLFYSEFLYESTPLMQAHVLISNKDRHYLLSFTDIAEHFEGENSEPLDVAWNSMTSARIEGVTPIRFEELYMLFGAAVLIIVLGTTVAVLNRYRVKRRMEKYSRGDGFDDEDDVEEISDATGVEVEFVSINKKRKKKAKPKAEDYTMEESAISSAHSAVGSELDMKSDVQSHQQGEPVSNTGLESGMESGFHSGVTEDIPKARQNPVPPAPKPPEQARPPVPKPPVPVEKVAEKADDDGAGNPLPPAPNPEQMSFHFSNIKNEAKQTSMQSLHDQPDRTQTSQIPSQNLDESFVTGLDDEAGFEDDDEEDETAS